jgi:murein DD-endopeptidase MepM/ murein hydrolase activator NlpD
VFADNAEKVAKRLTTLVGLAGLVVLLSGAGGAGGARSSATASASALAIQVVAPGQAGAQVGAISSPPDHAAFGSGFAYPADGSVVRTGSISSSTSAAAASSATASSTSQVQSLTVFNGEITASVVKGAVQGSTSGRLAQGGFSGATVSGLTILGSGVAAAPNARFSLADWGYVTTLEEGTDTSSTAGGQGFHGFVTALTIHLTAAHGALPAGSQIQVGYSEASVQASVAPPPKPVVPGPVKKQPTHHAAEKKTAPAPATTPKTTTRPPTTAPVLPVPRGLQPKLTGGRYVFPVYGPSVSFGDSYGAFRGDVSGNWHHGDDLFAPLGAPVLAVADGTVFSVGWNDVGGNRLWLRDSEGNEFYYAHLSAYTPLAKNNTQVKAGDVLGFVGNTGDAQGTPTHLHFEVHPYSLLFMGYDGAVDPTPYLQAWERLQDVPFADVASYLAQTGISDPAPKPAAILLQVSDISEASGLDPASLQRAMAASGSGSNERRLIASLGLKPSASRP